MAAMVTQKPRNPLPVLLPVRSAWSRFWSRFTPGFGPGSGSNSIALHHTRPGPIRPRRLLVFPEETVLTRRGLVV